MFDSKIGVKSWRVLWFLDGNAFSIRHQSISILSCVMKIDHLIRHRSCKSLKQFPLKADGFQNHSAACEQCLAEFGLCFHLYTASCPNYQFQKKLELIISVILLRFSEFRILIIFALVREVTSLLSHCCSLLSLPSSFFLFYQMERKNSL